MRKIIHLVIERFEIQSAVSFKTINIDDVAYEKFNNVSFYDIIRDKLFENNMLSSILME
jgi:hypothetical protein